MAKPLVVLKSVGPKLVPFFKAVTVYFVLYGSEKHTSVTCSIVKCAPVLALCAFVLMHGMSLSHYYAYSRRVLLGLLLSCLGDCLLVWAERGFFLAGMVSFGLAHLCYTAAFGFQRFGYKSCVCTVITALIIYWVMEPGLHGVMRAAVPVYIGLIWLMTWRSLARIRLFKEVSTWTTLVGCAGAISFVVSDVILAYEKFRAPVPFSHPIIMSTYYAGQLGIALSVVDSQADIAIRSSELESKTALSQSKKLK